MGRLGRDPELRYTQAGRPVASFSLAVDRDFKDKASGERATDWIPVVAWEARVGLSAGNLYQIERGVHDPRVDTLFLIAQALEVSADELLGLGARIGGLT